MSNQSKVDDTMKDFLLAEFTSLQDRAIAKGEMSTNRVNFFLLVVAAIIAGSSIFLETGQVIVSSDLMLLLAVSSTAILVLGIATLEQVVKHSVEIVFFYRLAGRVRRYFADTYEEIKPYLAFEPIDSRPKMDTGYFFIELRGGDAVLVGVNSLATAVLVSTLIAASNILPLNPLVYVFIALLVFFISWVLQAARIRAVLRNAEKIFERHIRFPSLNDQASEKQKEEGMKETGKEVSA